MENKKMCRVANTLDTLCRVGGVLFMAAAVVCAVFAVLVLIVGEKVIAAGSLTLNLDFVKLYLAETFAANKPYVMLYVMLGLLAAGVLCGVVSYAAKVARCILQPMKEGRPFEASVADNLKKLAIVVLLGGALSGVMGIVERMFLSRAFPLEQVVTEAVVQRIEYIYNLDLNFVLIGCVLLFLSYIFRYGQQLQQPAFPAGQPESLHRDSYTSCR